MALIPGLPIGRRFHVPTVDHQQVFVEVERPGRQRRTRGRVQSLRCFGLLVRPRSAGEEVAQRFGLHRERERVEPVIQERVEPVEQFARHRLRVFANREPEWACESGRQARQFGGRLKTPERFSRVDSFKGCDDGVEPDSDSVLSERGCWECVCAQDHHAVVLGGHERALKGRDHECLPCRGRGA